MWSWEARKSPPEDRYQPQQGLVENRAWLRNSSLKIAIVVLVLGPLLVMYRTAGGQTAHTLLAFPIVLALIFLLLGNRRDRFDPRPLSASSRPIDAEVHEPLGGAPQDLLGASGQLSTAQNPSSDPGPTGPEGLVPEGAKKVYDLKDLPPELAANPEVQKLFQMAGAGGAWVKVTRGYKSADSGSAGGAESGPETTKISFSIKRSGQPMQMGTTKEMSELPAEPDSNDPEQLARWVKSQGRLSSDARRTTLPQKALRRLILVGAAFGVMGAYLCWLYLTK